MTVGNNYMAFSTTGAIASPTTAAAIMQLNGAVFGNAYADLSCEYDTKSQMLPWFDATDSAEDNTTIPGSLNVGCDGYSFSHIPGKVILDYVIEFADPH